MKNFGQTKNREDDRSGRDISTRQSMRVVHSVVFDKAQFETNKDDGEEDLND